MALDLTKLVEAESNRSVATGKDPTGGLFGKVTKALKLPELGISESLGGKNQSVIDANKATLNKVTNTTTQNATQNSNRPIGPAVPTNTNNQDKTTDTYGGKIDTGSTTSKIGKSAIKNAAGAYGDWISDSQLSDIINKYKNESTENANKVSKALEDAARKSAERDYKDVMKALGVQKTEVSTMGNQQKENLAKQKELGLTDIEMKQSADVTKIGEEKQNYEQEYAKTKDDLGAAWRDMSMEVQRIARAGGRDSSSWAATQETGVLKDFNKGLRTLSEKSASAVKSFSDAVIETQQYYSQAKQKLELESKTALDDIDTWVRNQVAKIQSQQDMALSKKLTSIEKAINQGQQLKVNTANQIATAEMNFGLTLAQIQANYKTAVMSASSKNEKDANDTIIEAGKVNNALVDLVSGGMVVPVKNNDGTISLIGKGANGEDISIDMTETGFNTGIRDTIAAARSKNAEGYINSDQFKESQSTLNNAWFGNISGDTTTSEEDINSMFGN